MLRARAQAILAAGAALAALLVPVSALATTGTKTDLRATITITAKGTTWSPRIRNRHAATGTTLRVHVVNQGPGRHWFRLGSRQTKLLAKGASATFFYSFYKVGHVAWRSGPSKKLGSGTIPVHFPVTFH
jgi:hypothetical protein